MIWPKVYGSIKPFRLLISIVKRFTIIRKRATMLVTFLRKTPKIDIKTRVAKKF